jgi:hypothetical protein
MSTVYDDWLKTIDEVKLKEKIAICELFLLTFYRMDVRTIKLALEDNYDFANLELQDTFDTLRVRNFWSEVIEILNIDDKILNKKLTNMGVIAFRDLFNHFKKSDNNLPLVERILTLKSLTL